MYSQGCVILESYLLSNGVACCPQQQPHGGEPRGKTSVCRAGQETLYEISCFDSAFMWDQGKRCRKEPTLCLWWMNNKHRQDPKCSQARNSRSIWFYLQQCRSGSEQVACLFMIKKENQDSWRLWNLESKMNILSNLTCTFSISLIMSIYKKWMILPPIKITHFTSYHGCDGHRMILWLFRVIHCLRLPRLKGSPVTWGSQGRN